ncbi:hypothetical protein FKW77_002776 [Venturia effusa]|uniref:Uncharacterized protein n=1 Tax=Venturia effusa TaxID=50376 RepID=A0A517LNL7_9PEZI|nr:hypothetical protein FKW77_002776 [Venturia effusa]
MSPNEFKGHLKPTSVEEEHKDTSKNYLIHCTRDSNNALQQATSSLQVVDYYKTLQPDQIIHQSGLLPEMKASYSHAFRSNSSNRRAHSSESSADAVPKRGNPTTTVTNSRSKNSRKSSGSHFRSAKIAIQI